MVPILTKAEINAQIDALDVVAYSKTRNHLAGAVSRLSPYISRGVVTLPYIRDRVLERANPKAAEKFIQELAWREYFQRVWWAKGEAIFGDLRFPRSNWSHHELVTALVEAKTGITTIDSAVRELYEIGYMHNHARLWVASLATNLAHAHWFPMGQWLYAYLADGDLASNFLSWQWVAGTSVSKPYTIDQSLINSWSVEKQPYSFLNFRREDMLAQPCPEVLRAYTPFSLTMTYSSDVVSRSVAGEAVVLYTPWTLNHVFKSDGTARRILIFDPLWFDRFPVSAKVRDFIITQGKAVVSGLEIWSGDPSLILGYSEARSVYAISHQTNQHWSGVQFIEPEWLFPTVTGFYPSFFAYWQAVQKA